MCARFNVLFGARGLLNNIRHHNNNKKIFLGFEQIVHRKKGKEISCSIKYLLCLGFLLFENKNMNMYTKNTKKIAAFTTKSHNQTD